MTPERCVGLAALLLEYRDWLAAHEGESLDRHVVDYLVDRLAQTRRELLAGGAS